MSDWPTANEGDPAFYWDDLNSTSERDVRDMLNHPEINQHYLISIISEVDGGIIGYAIGIDHANEIVDALKRYAAIEANR